MKRVAFWSVPIVGGGLVYSFTVYTAANLRKKDGQLNHILGGFATGSVVGARGKILSHKTKTSTLLFFIANVSFFVLIIVKNFHVGLMSGLAIAAFGITFKLATLDGNDVFPYPLPRKAGNVWSHRTDWTLKKDYPGYWVKDESEVEALKAKGQLRTL